MWAKNLVFVGVVLAGVGALRSTLFPLDTRARRIVFDPGPTAAPDFRAVVGRVDAAFRAGWADDGLTPAPAAPDLTVARRLSLALTGSVPSLEEVRQFDARPAGDRVAGWATHLLRDRRFADYFADRLGRAYLGTEDGQLVVFRKRRFLAWLSGELARNTPYGRIVRDMIAGRGLNTDAPGVNFIAAAYDDAKKAPDPEKLAVRVSRAFLGLRIDCAQCHDHFLEPEWKQAHFQALAAYFGQTRQVATHVSDGDGEYRYEDRARGGTHAIDPSVPFLPELLPAGGTRREQLAGWLTNRQNVHFARATVNRVWAMLFNRPLRKRVEAQTLSEPAPPALDILAADFAAHDYDLHRLILLIASTEVFRLDSTGPDDTTPAREAAWAAFPLTRLRPEQVIGTVFQAAAVRTIDQNSHVAVRLARYFGERDFVARYGDGGDDEFEPADGTIPQRLLMMNGDLVDKQARDELLNASAQIAILAPDDRSAVEAAYLAVFTRRPTDAERDHFSARLAGTTGSSRRAVLADLYWVLFNSTELSFNH